MNVGWRAVSQHPFLLRLRDWDSMENVRVSTLLCCMAQLTALVRQSLHCLRSLSWLANNANSNLLYGVGGGSPKAPRERHFRVLALIFRSGILLLCCCFNRAGAGGAYVSALQCSNYRHLACGLGQRLFVDRPLPLDKRRDAHLAEQRREPCAACSAT